MGGLNEMLEGIEGIEEMMEDVEGDGNFELMKLVIDVLG